MKGTVLVTGANGFVGRQLCQDLLQRGYDLRGSIRTGRPRALTGVDYREVAALEDTPDWRPLLEDCGAVVHAAARVHVPASASSEEHQHHLRANAEASAYLARQAQAAGVTRLVFISSIAAQVAMEKRAGGDASLTPYQAGKLAAEERLLAIQEETGLEVVALRPPLVYGPAAPGAFRRLERALTAGWPLPLATIANRRAFLYVGNLTDAVAACLEHPAASGRVFAVSDGETHSTPEFVRMMAQAMGRPARLWRFPPGLLCRGLTLLGRRSIAEALVQDLSADNSGIEAALDWKPPWRTTDGLALSFPHGSAR